MTLISTDIGSARGRLKRAGVLPHLSKEQAMRLGLRALLVGLAVVLFIVSALTEENRFDFLAFGLAVFAASFVVEDVAGGWFRRTT
jgi:hypothetical protein